MLRRYDVRLVSLLMKLRFTGIRYSLQRFLRALSLWSCLIFVTACGGGGGVGQLTMGPSGPVVADKLAFPTHAPIDTADTATTDAATPTPASVPVNLSYQLPADGSLSSISRRINGSSLRTPQYTSASNTKITIGVTPFGGATATFGPTPCTTITCTISFTATPGPNTLVFTLTDNALNVLSSFSKVIIVEPNNLNTLKFTANPVVNTVTLILATATLNAGVLGQDLLTVNAKDIDGNTIAGTGNYLDLNGIPLALTISVHNVTAGGTGSVSIVGPPRITGPGQSPIHAQYDGNWLDHADISVNASSTAVTSLTGTTLTIKPQMAAQWTIPGGNTYPTGIVKGADGNLWFTEFTNYIEKVTTSGVFTLYSIPSGASNPESVALGGDGNVWFTEAAHSKIGRITTGGSVTEFNSPAAVANVLGYFGPNSNAPDGTIWYPESGTAKVVRILPDGTMTQIAVPANPGAMTAGPDNNLWVAAFNTSAIWRVAPSGVINSYVIPTAGVNVGGITTGGDGNIWFSEFNKSMIGRLVVSTGVITEFPTVTGGAGPLALVTGVDGNVWFLEYSINKIASITPAGVVKEYTAAGGPQGICVGNDGNIYFTEDSSNKIAKFVF